MNDAESVYAYVEEMLVLLQRSDVSARTSNNVARVLRIFAVTVLAILCFCVEAPFPSLRGDEITSLVHMRDSHRVYA